MIVGDDEFDALQASIGKRAQEALPEGFGLGRPRADAQHLAAAIVADTDSDYC
jgi:hypothetical protein